MSSCRLSICSRLSDGWKAKSNDSSVFTAGSREERIAACNLRLLRSVTCALRRRLIASVAAMRPPSISLRMPSTASNEPQRVRKEVASPPPNCVRLIALVGGGI